MNHILQNQAGHLQTMSWRVLVWISTFMVQFIWADFFFLISFIKWIFPSNLEELVSGNFPELISLPSCSIFSATLSVFSTTMASNFLVDLALVRALSIITVPTAVPLYSNVTVLFSYLKWPKLVFFTPNWVFIVKLKEGAASVPIWNGSLWNEPESTLNFGLLKRKTISTKANITPVWKIVKATAKAMHFMRFFLLSSFGFSMPEPDSSLATMGWVGCSFSAILLFLKVFVLQVTLFLLLGFRKKKKYVVSQMGGLVGSYLWMINLTIARI